MGISKDRVRELSLKIVAELGRLPPVEISLTAAESAEMAQLLILMNKDGVIQDESCDRAAKILYDAGVEVAREAGLIGAAPVRMFEMDEIIRKKGIADRKVSISAIDLSSLAAALIQSVHVGPKSSEDAASAIRKVVDIGDGLIKKIMRQVIMSQPEFSQVLN